MEKYIRLTTKMGEKEIKEWEKNREKSSREEKEQEAEVKRKIYEIRKNKTKERRKGENDTLPAKRRKIDSESFMSVKKDSRKQSEKRENNTLPEQPRAKRRQEEHGVGDVRGGGRDPEKEEQLPPPPTTTANGVTYGGWKNVEKVIIDWDKRIKDYENKKVKRKKYEMKEWRKPKGWRKVGRC